MAAVKELFVKICEKGKKDQACELEVPVGTSLSVLVKALEETVLGPEADRWVKIKEQRGSVKPNTDIPSGSLVDITTTYEAPRLQLFTHPGQDCAPVLNISQDELPSGVDLYQLLMRREFPEPRPLNSEHDIRVWWSSQPQTKPELRNCLMKRLVEKVTVGEPIWPKPKASTEVKMDSETSKRSSDHCSGSVGGESFSLEEGMDGLPLQLPEEDKDIHVPESQEVLAARALVKERMMLEGVQGIWELSCDRNQAARFSLELVEALLLGLREGPPAVQVIALAAVWNLVVLADVRSVLVKLGIIELIVEVMTVSCKRRLDLGAREGRDEAEGQRWSDELQLQNRVIFHALGALAVLAVDSGAREHWIKLSPDLDLLVNLCKMDFPSPEPPKSMDITANDLEPVNGHVEGAGNQAEASKSEHGPEATQPAVPADQNQATRAPEAAITDQKPVGESDTLVLKSGETVLIQEEPYRHLDEDNPAIHQKMAAEVLYSMLARDGEVRKAFTGAAGLTSFIQLLQSPNPDVSYCIVMAITAFSRDVTQDNAYGVDLLRGSGLASEFVSILLPILEEAVVTEISSSKSDEANTDSTKQALDNAVSSESGKATQDSGHVGHKLNLRPPIEVGRGCHPLLSLIEGAALALQSCVASQLGHDDRALDHQGREAGAPLSLSEVSRLARLAELLGQQLEGPVQQASAQAFWIAVDVIQTGESGLTEDEEETITSNLQHLTGKIMPLTCAVHSLLSCLACVHKGPSFLAGVHFRLESLISRIKTEENVLADHEKSLMRDSFKRRNSSASLTSFFDDSKSAASHGSKSVAAVEEAERLLETIKMELGETEEKLQAASEDSVSAVLPMLLLKLPSHPVLNGLARQLAQAQLMASGLALSMAEATHPKSSLTSDDPEPLYHGLFRQLMLDFRVLPALAACASSPLAGAGDPSLAQEMQILTSAAISRLVALPGGQPLSEMDLETVVQFMMAVSVVPGCAHHLSSAFWFLCQHEDSRQFLLKSSRWLELNTQWINGALLGLGSNIIIVSGKEDLDPTQHQQQPSKGGHRNSATNRQKGPSGEEKTSNGASTAAAGLSSVGPVSSPPDSSENSARTLRFCTMSLWLLLRQWLLDNMSPINVVHSQAAHEALYVRSETSWWAVNFDLKTPLTGLETDALAGKALALLLGIAKSAFPAAGTKSQQHADTMLHSPLWDMALRCCWSLSTAHPEVSSRLLNLGAAKLLTQCCSSHETPSPLLQTCCKFISTLLAEKNGQGLSALGGATRACQLLILLLERAIGEGDATGQGADVLLAELAVRGLSHTAKGEGRQAMLDSKGVRMLIEVVRLDNAARELIETSRQQRGVEDWDSPQELFCPLRAINGLPLLLGPIQSMAAKEMEAKKPPPPASPAYDRRLSPSPTAGSRSMSRCSTASLTRGTANAAADAAITYVDAPGGRTSPSSPSLRRPQSQSRRDVEGPTDAVDPRGQEEEEEEEENGGDDSQQGDADIGLMALWGLLNMSGFSAAQVPICRQGLYTLLGTVHRSKDPHRSSTAAAILNNIQFHPNNISVLYRAELRLKQAALTQLNGIERWQEKLHVGKPPQKLKPSYSNPSAASVSPHTKSMVRSHIAQGVEAAHQLTDQLDPSDPDRQMAEANLAFLQHLVDPETFVLGLPSLGEHLKLIREGLHVDLISCQGPDNTIGKDPADITEELMERLTTDPEEAKFLAFATRRDKIDDFSDSRANQGQFLRGNLGRSLAEGPHSLWGGRAAAEGKPSIQKGQASSRDFVTVSSPRTGIAHKSNRDNVSQRPGTAPSPSTTGNLRASGSSSYSSRAPPVPSNGRHEPPIKSSPFSGLAPSAAPVEGVKKPGKGMAMSKVPASPRLKPTRSVRFDSDDRVKAVAAPKSPVLSSPKSAVVKERSIMSASQRGATGPNKAGIRAHSPERVQHPGDWKHAGCAPSRRQTAETLAQEAAERLDRYRQRLAAIKPVPRDNQWAPQIIAFIQDRSLSQPRSELAQRLLSSVLPLPAVEGLAGIASSLIHPPSCMSDKFAVLPPMSNSGGSFGDGLFESELERGADHEDRQTMSTSNHDGRSPSAVSHSDARGRARGSFVASGLIQSGPLSTLDLTTSCAAALSSGKGGAKGQQALLSVDYPADKADTVDSSNLELEGQLKLSSEVTAALRRPGTAYLRPHQGRVAPEGTSIRSRLVRKPTVEEMLSTLHAEAVSVVEAKKAGEEPPMHLMKHGSPAPARIDKTVPRPTTILSASVPSLVALRQLKDREAEAEEGGGPYQRRDRDEEPPKDPLVEMAQTSKHIQDLTKSLTKQLPVSLLVATGGVGGPEKTFKFPEAIPHEPHNVCLFEHVEGCRVCSELYGHYLLPSGRLAHMFIGDTVRKGHRVDLIQPPKCPWETKEWFSFGLPICEMLSNINQHLHRAASLASALWCPVPELGPATSPGTHILEWEPGKEGRVLALRTVVLSAEVHRIVRQEVTQEVVLSKPPQGRLGTVARRK